MLRTAAKALLLALFLTTQAISLPNRDAEIGPRPGTGIFLMLSDIHFNPFSDSAIMEQLGAHPLPACQAPGPTSFSPLGSDTNYPLLRSALENVAATAESHHIHYDYVVLTGDLLAHQFGDGYNRCVGGDAEEFGKFTANTIRFVDHEISRALPGAPVFATLGNNDSDKGDYARPSPAFLHNVALDWSKNWGGVAGSARASAMESFSKEGYYALPDPEVAGNEFVVLNSNLWVAASSAACSAKDPDPGGEFAWMDQIFSSLRREQRSATLVMHVLPGIDGLRSSMGAPQPLWTQACLQKFIGKLSDFRGVVHELYAGHIHRDDFRILPDRAGKPLAPIHVSPSVSPVYFNNPGVQIGWYDKTTGDLVDSVTLYLDLANSKTAWALEYDFDQTYGQARPDLATLVKLSHEIREGNPDSGIGGKYAKFYNVGVGLFLTPKNWRNYTCTQTAFTPTLFTECKNSPAAR